MICGFEGRCSDQRFCCLLCRHTQTLSNRNRPKYTNCLTDGTARNSGNDRDRRSPSAQRNAHVCTHTHTQGTANTPDDQKRPHSRRAGGGGEVVRRGGRTVVPQENLKGGPS